MAKRFVSIWFRHLHTDWFTLRKPELKDIPFVLRMPVHGRMMITGASPTAEKKGIYKGMVLADARALTPNLEALDDKPELSLKLLNQAAEWCIRFTPIVAIDAPDGLILDATGCPHLWGGDEAYLADLEKKLNARGYDVRIAMADTIGLAWGLARFGNKALLAQTQDHLPALMELPPDALRLERDTLDRLHKLGLHKIKQFIRIPRSSLRRRFGPHFLMRLDMALGQEMETIEPVQPMEPYQFRLPSLEPIVTATGIEIGLKHLLELLCQRLQQEQKGLRSAVFKGYRVDGKIEKVEIGTHRATQHKGHLFKLFEIKLPSIEPDLGIELFVLEASKIEDYFPSQSKMWGTTGGLEDERVSELLDRLASKLGSQIVHRYLPDEHYWPERSYKSAASLQQKPDTTWRADKLRPLMLLHLPERIDVSAPIPDYPPMLFRYKGKVHEIARADGPERIEQEWWLQQGQHRDYYRVEDKEGQRYWLFRLGHYDQSFQWFIHGFFA